MGRMARNTDGAGTLTAGPGPVVVGILNVTPDSFSDGGDFLDPEAAAVHAASMLDEGACMLDVGGESTRPGSDPVPQEEEIRRVVPVIERVLALRPEAVISVDTYRSGTATAALEAGASLVNDVTALRGDPSMASVVGEAGCPVILMHMQGEPKTMQKEPHYEDVVREVRDFLAERAEYAVDAGVGPENIIVDPGIGFGKNLEHNLDLLRNLDAIVDLGFPVLIGASRKRFIERITGRARGERSRLRYGRHNGARLRTGRDLLPGARRARQPRSARRRRSHPPLPPPVSKVFLSLGSNLGDRLAYLRAVVAAFGRGPQLKITGISKVYETEPVEVEGEQPDYLNCVVELECGVPAIELLRYCQGIEAALGRERSDAGEKAPRTVDIDVLLFGEETITEPDLRVPHAGVTRTFNLRGLADLDADLYIPGRGTVGDLLRRADEGGILTFGEAEELC